jgi:DNA-binding IscR family transcriptional regulator
MRITRRGEYGLAAVLYLASQPKDKLSLGKNGGYYLRAEPGRLSLADVLEALEGPIELIRTIEHAEEKEADFLNTRVREFFGRLQTRGHDLLKSMKIAEMLPSSGRAGGEGDE